MKVPVARVESVYRRYRSPGTREKRWVLRGATLSLDKGESVGLVGESGAGKSTLARLLLGLEKPDRGTILFDDGLPGMVPTSHHPARRVQIVWQDPTVYLNPFLRVWELIAEPLRYNKICAPTDMEAKIRYWMDAVGLPQELSARRPHELSGGQCQRVAIARAVSIRPRLLICDEPLSHLDIPHQARILRLLMDLRECFAMTCLFISHDPVVVRRFCSRIVVLQNGRLHQQDP